MFTIDINEGARRIETEGGKSLLAALAEAGVWLPSICGGTTSCGECACEVRGDFDPPSTVERAVLGEEREAGGMRLACSVAVRSGVFVRIPPEVLAVRKRRVRVREARELALDTRGLVLDFGEEPLPFRPGQYLRVFVPPQEGVLEELQRAYSFASSPGSSLVSLVVKRAKGGFSSVWLHDRVAEGDSLEVVGPYGSFALPEGKGPLLCVAGGTGLAPFFPLLAEQRDHGGLEAREVVLVYGAKREEELFRIEELEELAKGSPRFRFIPVLQEAEGGWRGARGLVTDLARELLEAAGSEAAGWQAALCGSPGMVKACERLLARYGITGEAVRHDSFS